MPAVEELEPEPRNVPQRPLKREAKRGGRVRGRGGHRTQMCPALHNLSQCLSVERRTGPVFHPCQPYPPSQSTFHLEPTHPPTPPQALWQRSDLGFARLLSFPPAAFLCHILCLVSALIYGPKGSSVHV